MKIETTASNIATAKEIISWLTDTDDGKRDPVVSVENKTGRLLFYSGACGIDDENETVIYDPLEADSCGVGWEDATGEMLIDFLNEFAEVPQ